MGESLERLLQCGQRAINGRPPFTLAKLIDFTAEFIGNSSA